MLPSMHGAFHYAAIEGLSSTRSKRFKRSFDLHFQLRKEIGRFPAIAVDLHDFNGTEIYASEYLVATKTFGDRLAVTCGIGCGRLASNNDFKNPLCFVADRFCNRPASGAGGIGGNG